MRLRGISIRSVFIGTGLVAIALLPTMLGLRTRRREQALLDQLRVRGVKVWFVDGSPDSFEVVEDDYWYDAWSLVPSSWTPHPQRISIVQYRGESADLEVLAQLDTVKAVSYVHAEVDSELIDYFMLMDGLESLNLSDTNVGDQALERLVDKPNLRYLNLMGSKVTPEGVKAFNRARPNCKLSVSPDQEF
ncbi:MAG: hypothetical protein AAGG44_08930, partial [Planctomycetota bacterium]